MPEPERFYAKSNATTVIRNRGYDDGRAGRPATPPDDEALRSTYWIGYRRGRERHQQTHKG